MRPKYAERLVVAIKQNKCLEWYILEKDYCFMDYNKWDRAWRKKGYEVYSDNTRRFGIDVINEFTINSFLAFIAENKVTSAKLKKMLIEELDYEEKLAYNPSVLMDFDKKVFFSFYAEPESYEEFVPDGWKGVYHDFQQFIPKEMRYWIDEKGRNLIK